MIFKIDKYGVLSRVDDDSEIITQSSVGVNTLYVIVDSFENDTSKYLNNTCGITFTRDSEILMQNVATYVSNVKYNDKIVPCYRYELLSSIITKDNGTLTITIAIFTYNEDDDEWQKLYSTNYQTMVYPGVVVDDETNISEDQYDALMLAINKGTTKADETTIKLIEGVYSIKEEWISENITTPITTLNGDYTELNQKVDDINEYMYGDLQPIDNVLKNSNLPVKSSGIYTFVMNNLEIYETKEELTNTLTDYATKQYVQDYVNENITLALESDY